MLQQFSTEEKARFKKYVSMREKDSEIETYFFEKAYKYIKYIKWIPGVQMIGIGNSIALRSAKKSSDIDLYIVTDENNLWFVRIIATFIFQIFGVRKTASKHAGRFCLSFFSTKTGMDFSVFAIKRDIYLYFRVLYFKPIVNYNNTYELFLKKNKAWADFSGEEEIIFENTSYIKWKGQKKISNGIILNSLDRLLKKMFIGKTLRHYERLGKPYGILISDTLLKFHDDDVREELKRKLL